MNEKGPNAQPKCTQPSPPKKNFRDFSLNEPFVFLCFHIHYMLEKFHSVWKLIEKLSMKDILSDFSHTFYSCYTLHVSVV